jgi:prolyl oligopeptidase
MSASSASENLAGLFHDEWEARLRADPTFATWTGDTRYNDRLPDVREEAIRDRQRELQAFLDRLSTIDHDALNDTDRLNYDFFERELRLQVEDLSGPITSRSPKRLDTRRPCRTWSTSRHSTPWRTTKIISAA